MAHLWEDCPQSRASVQKDAGSSKCGWPGQPSNCHCTPFLRKVTGEFLTEWCCWYLESWLPCLASVELEANLWEGRQPGCYGGWCPNNRHGSGVRFWSLSLGSGSCWSWSCGPCWLTWISWEEQLRATRRRSLLIFFFFLKDLSWEYGLLWSVCSKDMAGSSLRMACSTESGMISQSRSPLCILITPQLGPQPGTFVWIM